MGLEFPLHKCSKGLLVVKAPRVGYRLGARPMMVVDLEEYSQLKHIVGYQNETISLLVNCIEEVYASSSNVPLSISQLMSRLDHPPLPPHIADREFVPNTVSPNIREDDETQDWSN